MNIEIYVGIDIDMDIDSDMASPILPPAPNKIKRRLNSGLSRVYLGLILGGVCMAYAYIYIYV